MLVSLLVGLLIIGVILWLVNTYVPMDPKIKSIFNAVLVIAVVVYLVYALYGLLAPGHVVHLP